MSISAVGTALGSLCKKCSCDCSKRTIIIIGKVENEESLEDVYKIVANAQRDLRASALEMERIFPQTRTVKTIQREKSGKNEELDASVDLGILKIAHHCVCDLKEGVDSEEAWARLRSAYSLCGVSLDDKLATATPLEKEEWKKLHAAVLIVKEHGSRAVSLWKLVRIYQGSIETLWEIGAISRKERIVFEKGLKEGMDLEADSFATLAPSVRKVFFDAAICISKKQRAPFQSFIEKRSDEVLSFDSNQSIDSNPSIEEKIRQEGARTRLDSVIEKLGGVDVAGSQSEMNLHYSLGILKAQIIGIRLQIDPNWISSGAIDESTIQSVEREGLVLENLSGAILYLFQLTRRTISIPELMKEEYISKEIVEGLSKEMKGLSEFYYFIRRSSELAALPPLMIAKLSRVAEFFSETQRAALNERYPSERWLMERRERTPSIPDQARSGSGSEPMSDGSDEKSDES